MELIFRTRYIVHDGIIRKFESIGSADESLNLRNHFRPEGPYFVINQVELLERQRNRSPTPRQPISRSHTPNRAG